MREPSLNQRNFRDYFLETFQVTESYRRAYPNAKMNDNAMKVEASRLLSSKTMQRMLKEKMTSAKPKPDDLNPEYIKEQLKKEIDNPKNNDGARVAALNIASKVFGMQTMKTEDVTEKMLDTDLALTLACAHYQVPVQEFDELDDGDKIFYSEVMKRLNGTINETMN